MIICTCGCWAQRTCRRKDILYCGAARPAQYATRARAHGGPEPNPLWKASHQQPSLITSQWQMHGRPQRPQAGLGLVLAGWGSQTLTLAQTLSLRTQQAGNQLAPAKCVELADSGSPSERMGWAPSLPHPSHFPLAKKTCIVLVEQNCAYTRPLGCSSQSKNRETGQVV